MTATMIGRTSLDAHQNSPAVPIKFSALLRECTTASHRTAERSGIVGDILTGKATPIGYALFLRNLLPAYQALEAGSRADLQLAGVDTLLPPELFRAALIECDLVSIVGGDWHRSLPLLANGARYADRITRARAADPALLLAHAYVRYLGDLSGGQIMMRLLARTLELGVHQLSFYAFPAIANLASYKSGYRHAIDALELDPLRQAAIAGEAVAAFEINIALSLEVQAAASNIA